MVRPSPKVEERGLDLALGVVKARERLDALIEHAAEAALGAAAAVRGDGGS